MKEHKYILDSTSKIHDDATEVYEYLMDGEYEKALPILDRIASMARDIKKTFSNEI